jgi:hypothetical protein
MMAMMAAGMGVVILLSDLDGRVCGERRSSWGISCRKVFLRSLDGSATTEYTPSNGADCALWGWSRDWGYGLHRLSRRISKKPRVQSKKLIAAIYRSDSTVDQVGKRKLGHLDL